ncbi:Importin subunit alpha-1b [Hibiscus syriacus]|uniref:Importin subunit alpha-1b n=1 Tax=Hibiscus syriacus TaxID=106335 RepID=A0A6A3D0H1_HIBSY|nr:Importin subunit alpha-1b [Hibiscus syriacus]
MAEMLEAREGAANPVLHYMEMHRVAPVLGGVAVLKARIIVGFPNFAKLPVKRQLEMVTIQTASSDKVLTNAERKRRNLTMNIGFPLCANPVEDIDHLLRKCPSTRTWSAVVKRERLVDLLSTDMKAWITMNIPNARDFVGTIENWDILFVAIIWNIWLQRNVIALDNPLEDECPILEKSKHWVEVISKTLAKAAIRTILVQRENSNSIRWQPLPNQLPSLPFSIVPSNSFFLHQFPHFLSFVSFEMGFGLLRECDHYSCEYVEKVEGKCCGECGGKISVSHGAFACQDCDVCLHISCAVKEHRRLSHTIKHPLHQHQLELEWLHKDFVCEKCLYISTGYGYRCYSCDFSLDFACASSAGGEDGKKKTIQHYSHRHRLSFFKYRKIHEEDLDCFWCEKHLSGVCYGCTRCAFYLHLVCSDKIPRTLAHPFHPVGHPLRLCYVDGKLNCNACKRQGFTFDDIGYMCQKCSFCLEMSCAKLLPTLKLACHPHILTYFRDCTSLLHCRTCGKYSSGADSICRCVQCDISFHLKCVVPSEATSKYHRHPLILTEPVKEDDSDEFCCDVCEEERDPKHPVYYCQSCTFVAHIQCLLPHDDNEDKITSSMENEEALSEKEMEQNEGTNGIHTLFQPIVHQHQMYEVTKELKDKKYCVGCRLVLKGASYFCKECSSDFYLHEECTKLPYEIRHPSHSSHPLYLYTSYWRDRFVTCDVCKDICPGFKYSCEQCNFILDVKCAALTAHKIGVSKEKKMDRVTELHHFSHEHKLVLGYCSDPIKETRCTICELSIFGPSYFCPKSCKFIVHESCLSLPQKIQVPFHPKHMLVIQQPWEHLNPQCYACPLPISRHKFAYSCEDCQLDLHPVCANYIKRPLKYVVQSKYHRHPLTLKNSFVEDDSGKYYCDFCEEDRNSNDHVYYCKECNGQTIAHIGCVLTREVKDVSYEESLQKKRLEAVRPQPSQMQKVPAMVIGVWTDDRNLQLKAITQFRELLSIEKCPPIDQVVQVGVVPRLVEFLAKENFPQLQFEAAWALTIIVSGTSENTKVVIDHGAVPIFVKLLGSPSADVSEQSMRALGNISGDSPTTRDVVLEHGALLPLLAHLNENAKLSVLRIATWTLSMFLRGKPRPSFHQVKPALPTLAHLIHSKDEQVLCDACWALSYLSDGTNDEIQAVIEVGVCGRLVELLLHPSLSVQKPALRTVGNIASGDDVQTQVISHQALPCLLKLLSNNYATSVKQEACRTISNITSGNREQKQAVIEADLIAPLLHLLQNAEFDIKGEAARAISNATSGGTHDQIRFLVSQGCIKPLCDLLLCRDPNIVKVCLKGLENILKVGEDDKTMGTTGAVNLYAQMISDARGLEKIKYLRFLYSNNDIYDKCRDILKTYWSE